jgi:hypothetical protein
MMAGILTVTRENDQWMLLRTFAAAAVGLTRGKNQAHAMQLHRIVENASNIADRQRVRVVSTESLFQMVQLMRGSVGEEKQDPFVFVAEGMVTTLLCYADDVQISLVFLRGLLDGLHIYVDSDPYRVAQLMYTITSETLTYVQSWHPAICNSEEKRRLNSPLARNADKSLSRVPMSTNDAICMIREALLANH